VKIKDHAEIFQGQDPALSETDDAFTDERAEKIIDRIVDDEEDRHSCTSSRTLNQQQDRKGDEDLRARRHAARNKEPVSFPGPSVALRQRLVRRGPVSAYRPAADGADDEVNPRSRETISSQTSSPMPMLVAQPGGELAEYPGDSL
jgi:hypothetical protein